MAIPAIIAKFHADAAQASNLIMNAHMSDSGDVFLLPLLDRQQITVAAFLNLFIAWESFLEASITDFMTGQSTINGNHPVKYVAPTSVENAQKMMVWTQKYFDYANHQNVIKAVGIYFRDGYPYLPHLNAIYGDMDDLRTIRNSCAHISSTTQRNLETLALRLFGQPRTSITTYDLLTSIVPRINPTITVFDSYKSKLTATADLIANG